MDPLNTTRLEILQGQVPTERDLRNLEDQIARQSPLPSRGVRHSFPWGWHPKSEGRGGSGGLSPIFAPTVAKTKDGYSVAWERGLLAGIEPVIGDKPISGTVKGKPGKKPVFTVKKEDFANGEAKVYFKCSLGPDYSIAKAEPFASGEVPKTADWTAYKLALLIFEDARVWRAIYSNQGFLAINRHGGRAQHLWWGKM